MLEISQLLDIEDKCFAYDKLSKKSFAYHIKKGNIITAPDNVGYILLITYKKTLKIYSIAILPNYQGKGIAKYLIGIAIDIAKEGNRTLVLECKEELRNFYTKLGFEEYGRKDNYYTDGSPAIKFKKSVA